MKDYAGAITAIATVVIALFTFFLYRVSAKLTNISERQSKAVSDLERPWLFIEKIRVERREGAPINPKLANNWFISFVWRNVGRTPAVVEECIYKIEPTDSLSEEPDYSGGSRLGGFPSTVARDIEFETRRVGPGEEKRVINGDAIELTVYGKLTYKKLNGEIHHTGFAIDVSPHLPASQTHNRNRKYEYFD